MNEDYILRNWAVETINRKLRNGVSFDLLRRGFGSQDEDEPISAAEEKNLYGVYL